VTLLVDCRIDFSSLEMTQNDRTLRDLETVNYCFHNGECPCEIFYENVVTNDETKFYQELQAIPEYQQLLPVLETSSNDTLRPLKKLIKLIDSIGSSHDIISSPTVKLPKQELRAIVYSFCAMIASNSNLIEVFDTYLDEPYSLEYVLEKSLQALNSQGIDSCDVETQRYHLDCAANSGMSYFSLKTLNSMLGYELFSNLELPFDVEPSNLDAMTQRLLCWTLRYLSRSVKKITGMAFELDDLLECEVSTCAMEVPSSLNADQ